LRTNPRFFSNPQLFANLQLSISPQLIPRHQLPINPQLSSNILLLANFPSANNEIQKNPSTSISGENNCSHSFLEGVAG
jgi:hypothetical protein